MLHRPQQTWQGRQQCHPTSERAVNPTSTAVHRQCSIPHRLMHQPCTTSSTTSLHNLAARQSSTTVCRIAEPKADAGVANAEQLLAATDAYKLANSSDHDLEQPPEAGVLPRSAIEALEQQQRSEATASASTAAASTSYQSGTFSYPPSERSSIRESWETLMRWSKALRTRSDNVLSPLELTNKIVVFGGGSFGTAMGAALARQKADLEVVLLLRDPYLCKDINQQHCNTKYLKVWHADGCGNVLEQQTDTAAVPCTTVGVAGGRCTAHLHTACYAMSHTAVLAC
jgi:ribosomal protein L37AE/L43A